MRRSLLSRLLSFFCSSYDSRQVDLSNMEAIKKKMQAMKVTKNYILIRY